MLLSLLIGICAFYFYQMVDINAQDFDKMKTVDNSQRPEYYNQQQQNLNILDNLLLRNNRTATIELMDNTNHISKFLQKQIFPQPVFDLAPITQNLIGGKNFLQSRSSICRPLEVVISYMIAQVREFKGTEPEIFDKALELCEKILVEPGVSTRAVCYGFLENIVPTFFYVIYHGQKITSNIFVSTALQEAGCSTSDETMKWDIRVEKNNREFKDFTSPSIQPSTVTKIIHLTDIHLDPLYRYLMNYQYLHNSNAECADKFLCCRSMSGLGENSTSQLAGYWGDYRRCGTPIWTFNVTIRQLAKNYPNAKFIFLTGDFICQSAWNSNKELVTTILTYIIKMIEENFPKARIIFSYGTFDTYPAFQYVSTANVKASRFIFDWNFNSTYIALQSHLHKNQEDNFLTGGYYSVEIDESLKIISLNTNFCYGLNMWIMFLNQDPAGQFRWLVTELKESEDNSQLVYIVGHISPGNLACDRHFSRNFYKILQRFKNTIKAQWYGFTHTDEFKVFFDPSNPTEPINSAFITGSLTSYRNYGRNNPGYKIFYVDGARGKDSTWDVLDYEAWIFNLEKANLNPRNNPKWFKLYTAREAMGIPNLSHKNLAKYLYKIAINSTKFELFYKRYSKLLDTDSLEDTCDVICRKLVLCSLVQPYLGEYTNCKLLDIEVDGIGNEREDSSYMQTQKKTNDLIQNNQN